MHCKTIPCHGGPACFCACSDCLKSPNENADLVSGNPAECKHEKTRTETETRSVARWVSPSDENYDENDPQETVHLTDHMVLCADCGECLDVSYGD